MLAHVHAGMTTALRGGVRNSSLLRYALEPVQKIAPLHHHDLSLEAYRHRWQAARGANAWKRQSRLPELYCDSQGKIGFADFAWKEFKILGEFDGFEKYSAQRCLKGKTPSKVVVEEKRREDRLRAKG